MKLSLSIEEDEDYSKNFFDKLDNELKYIVDEIRSKSKEECPIVNKDNSGAFGSIQIKNNKVMKLINLIPEDKQNTLLRDYTFIKKKSQLYFLINRLNNYCNDIKLFIKNAQKFFPNNFLDTYKCNLCKKDNNDIPYIYVEMALGKGITLKDALNDKNFRKKDLISIFLQIYYISLTLNMKKLYHNDLKPANIIITKSNQNILYKGLSNNKKEIEMKLLKDNYYPIIIDYDLTSKEEMNPVEPPEGTLITPGSPDYSFFVGTTSKINKKYEKMLKTLPEFYDNKEIKNNIDNIFSSMKKYENILNIKMK